MNDIQNNTVKEVDYLDGFQYAGGVLQFFPHAEGYVAATQGTKTDSNGNFVYIFNYVNNYTDHLGNIRVSYTKDPVSGELEIMEETEARGSRTPNKRRSHKTNDSEQNHTATLASFDLEILNFQSLARPFGLKHAVYSDIKQKYELDEEEENLARPTYVYETEYQYKYNGKEWQDELGLAMYDYGFRDYDPALGRWNVVDQLSEMYQSTSPYAYVANNPLINREIDGRYFEEGSKSERQAARIEKHAENRANRLERKADRLDAKGKSTGDLRDRAGELRQTAQDVRDMRGDKSTEYRYASVNGKQAKSLGVEGPATVGTGTNGSGDQVVTMFTEKSMGNQIHETRHGGQHFRGEIDVVNQVSNINAEVSAYRAQYSWNGSLQLPTLDVNSISNIVDFQTNIHNRVLLDNGRFPPQVNITNVTNIGQINRSLIQNIVEIGVAGGSGSLPTVQNYLLWIYAPLP